MSEPRISDWFPVSSDRTLARFAVLAMVAWALLELAFRRGLGPLLSDPLGTGVGAAASMLAFAFPVIALTVAWWGTRVGIDRDDWDYALSLRTVGSGIGGFVAYVLIVTAVTTVYGALLGTEPSLTATDLGLSGAPLWAVALFFVGNAIIVPISEELAWRGVIQTALTESYGTYVAIAVTTLAFVAKHLVVDMAAPLYRVTSLVVLALVLCGLRARYGTTSSTVAHVGMNVLSTAPILVA